MIANPNDIARYPATAHIPGAVEGKTCADCKHLDPCKDKNRGRCVQHFRFRGLDYLFSKEEENWWHGLGSISAATPACKYFAQEGELL